MSDLEIPYTFVEDTDAEAAQVNANFAEIEEYVNELVAQTALQSVPLGVPLPFGGEEAPGGYLMCQGQAISRTDYSALFAVLGTKFGVGNGTTTFNLPDYTNGRAPVGAGGSFPLGAKGGATTHTLTANQMPPHTHGSGTTQNGDMYTAIESQDHQHWLSAQWTAVNSPSSGTSVAVLTSGGSTYTSVETAPHSHTVHGTTASSGGGQAHNIMGPWQATNWIMRSGL